MSARSNASAKNRRAGGSETVQQQPQQLQQQMRPGQGQVPTQQMRPGQGQGPTQQMRPGPGQGPTQQMRPGPGQGPTQPQQQQQQQQMRQGQGQKPPPGAQLPSKMSIGDAIGLITLRLGKVEQDVFELQNSLPEDNESDVENVVANTPNPNARIIDDSVFKSIVSRLEKLESQKPTIVQQPVVQQDFTEMTEITSKVEGLQDELKQVKDLLLSLQSFTMETNQKLANIVFSDNQEFDEQEQFNEPVISEFIQIDGMTSTDLSENQLLNVVNLKELISQELTSSQEEPHEFNSETIASAM
uniref:Uncharacterized protein n=1 Tax=viral metagenome TaxID=1070528 RepID=A0A6C0HYF7_9ZZZZ